MFKTLILPLLFISCLTQAADLPAGARFKKVLIIVLENTDYTTALQQPYLKALTERGALLQQMNGVAHPSQGNYISMIGGATLGVRDDNPVNLKQNSVVDLLEAKGYSWKGYMEEFPGNCFSGATKGRYVRKHNPFISFVNIANNPARCANIQDLKSFEADALSGHLPHFSILSPNMDHDGHDTGPAVAAQWLQKNFENKLNDPAFMKDLLVVITYDESSTRKDNHIYTLLLGDSVRQNTKNNQSLSHINILKTVENEFGLGDLGQLDRTAAPIDGIWK